MQYASCIPVLLLALLAALTRGDESQPQPSSQSVSDHDQVRSALAPTFDEDEEEKRAWRELSSSWGKRGWQDLQSSGWGKRGWQDLQSSGWGKRGWQDLQSPGWGKRGWQDLQSPGWGKRGWQDLQSSGWGKRGWKDMPSQGWGKRAWKDLNSSWGKRGWQDLQGSWGKRDASPLDYPEDEDYSGEDKRAWENLRGTWGKRSGDWDNYRDTYSDSVGYPRKMYRERKWPRGPTREHVLENLGKYPDSDEYPEKINPQRKGPYVLTNEQHVLENLGKYSGSDEYPGKNRLGRRGPFVLTNEQNVLEDLDTSNELQDSSAPIKKPIHLPIVQKIIYVTNPFHYSNLDEIKESSPPSQETDLDLNKVEDSYVPDRKSNLISVQETDLDPVSDELNANDDGPQRKAILPFQYTEEINSADDQTDSSSSEFKTNDVIQQRRGPLDETYDPNADEPTATGTFRRKMFDPSPVDIDTLSCSEPLSERSIFNWTAIQCIFVNCRPTFNADTEIGQPSQPELYKLRTSNLKGLLEPLNDAARNDVHLSDQTELIQPRSFDLTELLGPRSIAVRNDLHPTPQTEPNQPRSYNLTKLLIQRKVALRNGLQHSHQSGGDYPYQGRRNLDCLYPGFIPNREWAKALLKRLASKKTFQAVLENAHRKGGLFIMKEV